MLLFVNQLTNVDFSYLDSHRGLVGETWLANISLEGILNEQGMVCDFGIVKKVVRQWLDETLDHCLLVPTLSSSLDLQQTDKQTSLSWQYNAYELAVSSPQQAITFIEFETITPESVAAWSINKLRALLPDTIERITLEFVPENIMGSYYHYSHGLKKHDGNCQRIAHGHRSTIEIYKNEIRMPQLEANWSKQWQDIYLGTEENIVEESTRGGDSYLTFAYEAPQGEFRLSLPKQRCDVITTESTVEQIAQTIANRLKAEDPNSNYRVHAFEGFNKGAVAYA